MQAILAVIISTSTFLLYKSRIVILGLKIHYPMFSKKRKKFKNYQISKIWAKNVKNFNFCNFWAISTIYTSKESIFHVELKFCHEKYFLFQKKIKKIGFFHFFIKNYADQLDSTTFFSKLVKKISKMTFSGLIRRLELKSHQI